MKEKILLHVCCGPCSIYPLELLTPKFDATCYFYNPNIYPEDEYARRLTAAGRYSSETGVNLEYNKGGDNPDDFNNAVSGKCEERCEACYRVRLESSARKASDEGYKVFSTTLLYSKYMNHEKVKSAGGEAANRYGIDFYYYDFREGWKRGIDVSRELGMYRQNYCGCVYSLKEREERLQMKKKKETTERKFGEE